MEYAFYEDILIQIYLNLDVYDIYICTLFTQTVYFSHVCSYMFQFIQKEKLNVGIIEKLCQRFREAKYAKSKVRHFSVLNFYFPKLFFSFV